MSQAVTTRFQGLALDVAHAAVDDMFDADLALPGDSDLLGALRSLERLRNRLAAVDHALVAEVDQRGLCFEHGCADTGALLAGVLRLTRAEARQRVRAAQASGPRRSLSGESLPPVFADVAGAQAQGAISQRHADVVVRAVDTLPHAVTAEHGAAIERSLVDAARTLDARELGVVAARLGHYYDPDGTLSDDEHRRRTRDLRLQQRCDGSARLTGELTAECAERFLAVLDTLARPRRDADGAKDSRTPGQRRHDGLLDACDRLLRTGTLPDCGGVSTTVVVTMSAESWRTGRGTAVTGHGGVMRAADAIAMAGGDYRIFTVALTSTREIAGYGTAHRLFSENQRLAMTARDGGCTFPGCDVPAAWCQADHVVDHADGGLTTVANGHLLCGFHHRNKGAFGWSVRMVDGRPGWIPPPWLDAARLPRFNHAHHPEGLAPVPSDA